MWREGKKLVKVARLWASGQIHHPDPDDDDNDNDESNNAPAKAATTIEALAIFGVVPVDPEPPADADAVDGSEAAAPGATAANAGRRTVCVWPCNLQAYNLWLRVQTQWRVGPMGGKTGLDYTGVDVVMRQMGIKAKDRPECFDGLQAMEVAAINVWALQQPQPQR